MQTLTLRQLFMAGCCLLFVPGIVVLAQVRFQHQKYVQTYLQNIAATASLPANHFFSMLPYQDADRELRLIADADLHARQTQHNAQYNTQQNIFGQLPSAASLQENLHTTDCCKFSAIAYNTNPDKPETRDKQPGLL